MAERLNNDFQFIDVGRKDPKKKLLRQRKNDEVFSSLNSGIPKVSRPPISGFLSNTTGVTPPRTNTSAQPRHLHLHERRLCR